MTLDLLNKIMPTLQTVCNTVYETKQFTAAFTKAFHALLRIGEFTVSKGNTPATILLFDDISMQQIKIHWQSIIQKRTNKVWGQTCTFLLQMIACPFTACMPTYRYQHLNLTHCSFILKVNQYTAINLLPFWSAVLMYKELIVPIIVRTHLK